MPSKKKARGKARRAAKSRRAREDDGAVNDIESEMQQLQISNINKNSSKEEDEDALLEAAINLAAAEREELEEAAKNDEVKNSEICNHGLVSLSMRHVCEAFIQSFVYEFQACSRNNVGIIDGFKRIYEAMRSKYAEVWNGPDNLQWVASYFVSRGTNRILEGDYLAGFAAMCSSFFEQRATIVVSEVYQNETQVHCDWNIFQILCDWNKIVELYDGDEHTLVSFFRKRITCTCLDKKYKEVKSIKKIGFCDNTSCSLPGQKATRSTMLSCTQCRKANYCSRECQVAHWPRHKEFCVIYARGLAAQKSRQKK